MKRVFLFLLVLISVFLFPSLCKADSVEGLAFRGIRISNTLQANATFYVSSGTVTNLQTNTLTFGDGSQMTTAATGGGGGGGGSGGYAVQPATVTFLLNKGLKTSTETITSLSPGVMHIVSGSSNVVTGLVSLSTEVTGSLPAASIAAGSLGVGVIASSVAVNSITNTAIVSMDASKLTGTVPNSTIDGSSITKQGNTFNGNNQLLQLNGSSALPSLNGANLTSLTAANLTGQVPAGNLSNAILLQNTLQSGSTFYVSSGTVNNLNIGTLSGVLKATSGSVTGSATTSDVPEGTNQYFTTARATTSVTGTAPIVNTNGAFSLGNSGVTAATYGSATQVPSVTLAANGTATSASNVTISLTNSNLQSGTYSNVTIPAANIASGSLGALVLVSSLTATGVTNGSYGSATQVPGYTVGSDGRLTAASNTTISLTNSNLQSGTYSNVTVPAANVATGNLGNAVVVSSVAVGAVLDASIVSVAASKLTGTVPNASLDSSSVTLQGNTFNVASKLVQLNGSTQLPAVSGALLTNLPAANLTGTVPAGSLSNAILNQNTLQSGATFFVSSGTATNFNTTTLNVAGTTTGIFDKDCDALNAIPPGSNSPYVSRSTSETSGSLYFDDTSTQSATCSFLVEKYDGRPLSLDIFYTSTATTNAIDWGAYTSTQTANVITSNYDSPVFSVIVTTVVTVSPNSNSLSKATVVLSNTTAHNDDILIVKIERQAGAVADNAVGYGRVKKLRVYE